MARRRGFREPTRPAYAFERRTPGAGWTITVSLGGFADVPIPWAGETLEEVRTSFLEFIENGDVVRQLDPEQPHGIWRTVDVTFHGVPKKLVFRSDWVSGFTIERAKGN